MNNKVNDIRKNESIDSSSIKKREYEFLKELNKKLRFFKDNINVSEKDDVIKEEKR